MNHRYISMCLIGALFCSGCKAPTSERVVLRHDPQRIAVENARFSGQYRLYAAAPRFPTRETATPLIDERLTRGETFGFARDNAGVLMAVVRGQSRTLPQESSSFTWTRQADPGQFDPDRTVLLVITVVVVTAVSLAAVHAADPWACIICFD